MILKIVDFLKKIATSEIEDIEESVSEIDSFLSRIEEKSREILDITDKMLGGEDSPEIANLKKIPDGEELSDLINFLKNDMITNASSLLDGYVREGDNPEIAKKLYVLILSTMKNLRLCIEKRKRDEKEYLEMTKTAKKNDFISKAIKKPGSLRKHYNVKEGEDIPVGRARKDYSRLKKKSKEGELSKSELSLLRKLSLYLNVLRPASQKQKD